jgi:hypothetical protein
MAFLLPAAAVFAQMNTAEITGVVKDPSGEVIAGAVVVAQNAATRLRFTAVTNNTGEYLLAQLPVGEYSLTVSVQGFKQAVSATALHVGEACGRISSWRLAYRPSC